MSLNLITTLTAIKRHDHGTGANIWELAEDLNVDEWTMRAKLSRLGRKGYIDGCYKLHCRCRCDVTLTTKGQRIYDGNEVIA